MRYLAIVAAGAFIIAAGASANSAPLSPAGVSAAGDSGIVLVQDKKAAKPAKAAKASKSAKAGKSAKANKPMKKMKRAMKRAKGKMMGWNFTAHCITGTMSCNKGGNSQFEARNACILTHPGCFISDSK